MPGDETEDHVRRAGSEVIQFDRLAEELRESRLACMGYIPVPPHQFLPCVEPYYSDTLLDKYIPVY